MGRHASSAAKVICFTCRDSGCACVQEHNLKAIDLRKHSHVGRVVAWLGGACLAGGALGAALALLVGG